MPARRRQTPEVSIVTPYLNAERHLGQAIESMLGQSFGAWEALLVDDGSSDASGEIARRYAARHPGKIRCARHPGGVHRGTFAARILGARRSRAPVLALLDADDTWDRDYLRAHLRFWRKHEDAGVALSYGPAFHWHPGASAAKDFVQTMPSRKEAVFPAGALLQNFLSGGFAGAPKPSCCFLRRDAFLRLAPFSEDASRSPSVEDWFLAWGIGARWPIAVHTRALVRYRRRYPVDAIPRPVRRKSLRDESRALRVIRDYLAKHQPGHALLRSDGIPARLGALSGSGRLPRFGDFFLRRVPEDLLRLSRRA